MRITEEHVNTILEDTDIQYVSAYGKVLVGICKLPNGWVETIDAACIDPENFDEKIGKSIIRERLKNKIWELEGYVLQQRMYENGYGS